MGGVAAGRRGDQEGEVGRAVLGAELDLRSQACEGQGRYVDPGGAAVGDRDATREARGGGALAGDGVRGELVRVGRATGVGDHPREGADDLVLLGAEVGVEAHEVGGDEVGHGHPPGVRSRRVTRTSSGCTCLGVGDRRAGESRGRTSVGHGQCESLVGVASGDVPEEVAEEAGVAGADGADDRRRRRSGVPGARVVHQNGSVRTERHQDALHPARDQVTRGGRGRSRVGLEVVGLVAGERGELLAVGLHQVGRAGREGVDEGLQRGVARVDRDPGAGGAQGGDQLGVPLRRARRVAATRRARSTRRWRPGGRAPR